jgi:hypothetical protein
VIPGRLLLVVLQDPQCRGQVAVLVQTCDD